MNKLGPFGGGLLAATIGVLYAMYLISTGTTGEVAVRLDDFVITRLGTALMLLFLGMAAVMASFRR